MVENRTSQRKRSSKSSDEPSPVEAAPPSHDAVNDENEASILAIDSTVDQQDSPAAHVSTTTQISKSLTSPNFLRWFSVFETILGALFLASLLVTTFIDSSMRFGSDVAILYTVANPGVIALSLIVFMEIFLVVLTGRTFLANAVHTLATPTPNSETSPKPQPQISTTAAAQTPEMSLPAAYKTFDSVVSRSAESLLMAQRRPNALLFVGTTIAAAGLIFFVATLPGFLTEPPPPTASLANDLYRRLIELTPRLLMLIFIQYLAGFFLRQYRVSMEEVRYYERILRFRESQFLNYQILSNIPGADLHALANGLTDMRDRELLRLRQGESTMILEAQRLEANEFKDIPEKMLDFFRSGLATVNSVASRPAKLNPASTKQASNTKSNTAPK